MLRETQCGLLDLRPEAAREFAAGDPLDRPAHALHGARPRDAVAGVHDFVAVVDWIDGDASTAF
jgi:hypothetical protein